MPDEKIDTSLPEEYNRKEWKKTFDMMGDNLREVRDNEIIKNTINYFKHHQDFKPYYKPNDILPLPETKRT